MTAEGLEERARYTLATNLSRLCTRAEAVEEQIRICISMLAESATRKDERPDTLYKKIMENAEGANAGHKAMVCACLCDAFSFRDQLIQLFDRRYSSAAEGISTGAAGRIAYVRNKRSDDIFLGISKSTKGAKAHYGATFGECCEAVVDGSCEYCLLPIENSSDGKLYSFYSLLDRYELKINKTVSVGNEDDSQTVVYALVGKDLRISSEGGQRLEFSLISENADFLSDVIRAACELGGAVSSIGTQPIEYDELRKRFYIAVDMKKDASPIPMALYMALEYMWATPLGIYSKK